MKVLRVQSPRSKVQSPHGQSRKVSDFGRWALRFGRNPSRFGDRNGIALVITLIMLSIITFLTVTFLVLSTRERGSVTTAMDQKIARDAADTGFSRVSAQLLARMMLNTNFQDFDLMVSTNYYNANGFRSLSPNNLNPTNVNYDYLNGGAFLPISAVQDWEMNIANLQFDPRPPVFIKNPNTGGTEFRYYLDLNRNGRFDRNGGAPVVMLNNAGVPNYVTTNGLYVSTNLPITGYLITNYFVGDPEWVGVLARPWDLHSADNQFTSRYAYIVTPVGKALDLNTMYNQAKQWTDNSTFVMGSDGYIRNQGVGPWELNLPAFLTDLNTNIWPGPRYPGYNPANAYEYNRPFGTANLGLSFNDAFSILSYRYNNAYRSLYPANVLFPTPGDATVDAYSDGPIMTSTTNVATLADPVAMPWAGAENTNHYFSPQDLFNQSIVGAAFAGRLQQAGTSNDSYNAYTFYRMLSQLGTDSTPNEDKLNINYKNTDNSGNIIPGMETNHIPWTSMDFFTNAANRMLAQFSNNVGLALSTTYIPVYPTNYYTPSVHRALQLAANIFDATTNQTVPLVAGQTNAFFPSVFRPVFTSKNGQIYISGYREVTDISPLSFQFKDFNSLSNAPGTYLGINVYGVPWVVGAKKGLPNFNQYAYQTTYTLTRKLKFQRVAGSGVMATDYKMSQEYVLSVTNQVGMDAWNSYLSQWPMASRKLRLYATNIFSLRIMNDTNASAVDLIPPQTVPAGKDFQPGTWAGYNNNFPASSFQVLIDANNLLVNGDAVSYNPGALRFDPGPNFYQPTTRAIPQFYMITTNHVVYALIDQSAVPNPRIIDFVNLDDSGKVLDFTGTLEAQANAASIVQQPYRPEVILRTNQVTGPVIPDAVSDGLNFQIEASAGMVTVSGWNDAKADPNNQIQIGGFQDWFLNEKAPVGSVYNGQTYTPSFVVTNQASWEANDPLVHYTIPDLTDANPGANKWAWVSGKPGVTHRYVPWNFDPNSPDIGNTQAMAKKDPGAWNSDAWDFPTNKFWNLGILGRVHRGTPWQTVYMKSPIIAVKDWQNWSGNFVNVTNPVNNRPFADTTLDMPNADYKLFDLFTTSPDPNASRGQLSINQTNLAAWSAVLSGVNVITNINGSGSAYIQPAGVYDANNPNSPVAKIWQGILRARNNNGTNGLIFPNHTFQHLGDVLATPELTVASPYIPGPAGTANDEVYERIPQQIMSLLALNQSPRFVIYSFGQTLHPAADHPLVSGGTFNGLCTNYQITAESATRAVVRVEGTSDPKYVNGRVDSLGRSYPPHLVVEQFNVLGPD